MKSVFGAFTAISFAAGAIFILAAVIIIVALIKTVRRRIGSFGNINVSSFDDFESRPRSLSGKDSLLLPKILRDFPDFNVTFAKSEVRKKLTELFGDFLDFKVHNVVISDYKDHTVVFQAAFGYIDGLRTVQKRYELNYTFAAKVDGVTTVNCPNCGAPVSSATATVCEYCDSRLVNALGNSWDFTDIYEK